MNLIDKFHNWRRKLRWNKQYKSGKWDGLKSDIETIRYQTIIDYISQFGITNPSILDLGCGEGILCERLKNSDYSRFLGMDFSSVSTEKASKKSFKNAEFICTDIHQFLPTQKYDVIVFNEVFYYIHAAEKEKVLQTIMESLQPDGIIICSMFRNHKSDWIFFDSALTTLAFETVKSAEENKFWQIGVYKKSSLFFNPKIRPSLLLSLGLFSNGFVDLNMGVLGVTSVMF